MGPRAGAGAQGAMAGRPKQAAADASAYPCGVDEQPVDLPGPLRIPGQQAEADDGCADAGDDADVVAAGESRRTHPELCAAGSEKAGQIAP